MPETPISVLRDAAAPPATAAADAAPESMVRTQMYLTRREYEFLQTEGKRRGEPMAAVIRSYIEEKMTIPDEAWEDNPLLRPPVRDPDWQGHEDGAVNHDHYVYGCPKKWVKQQDKWAEAPALAEEHSANPPSRQIQDKKIARAK